MPEGRLDHIDTGAFHEIVGGKSMPVGMDDKMLFYTRLFLISPKWPPHVGLFLALCVVLSGSHARQRVQLPHPPKMAARKNKGLELENGPFQALLFQAANRIFLLGKSSKAPSTAALN